MLENEPQMLSDSTARPSTFNRVRANDSDPLARKFGVLTLDGYSVFDVCSLLQVFGGVADVADSDAFEIYSISCGDNTVSEIWRTIECQGSVDLADSIVLDAIFVFSDSEFEPDSILSGWLRYQWRRGAKLCGVAGGVFVLAHAGLLENKRCTTHWKDCERLRQRNKTSDVTSRVYEVDGRIVTCGGGVGTIDISLMFVKEEVGDSTANQVAEHLLHSRNFRLAEQRYPLRIRLGTASKPLIAAVTLMHENVEFPVERNKLAAQCGITIRQLERLFKNQLKSTIGDYYKSVRLKHAQLLLKSTEMNITEVAIACGFANSSHFTRNYRQTFGVRPSLDR